MLYEYTTLIVVGFVMGLIEASLHAPLWCDVLLGIGWGLIWSHHCRERPKRPNDHW